MVQRKLIACSVSLLLGCSAQIDSAKPSITALDPSAICADQDTAELTLRGAHFDAVPTGLLNDQPHLVLPKVSLRRTADTSGGAVASSPIEVSSVRWRDPAAISFSLGPSLGLEPGRYTVIVTGFDGQTAELLDGLVVIERPHLTQADPDLLCADRENMLTLAGRGFIKGPDGSLPRIMIDDQMLEASTISECTPFGANSSFQSCNRLELQIPSMAIGPGMHTVSVLNAPPIGCTSAEAQVLELVSGPKIDALSPELICESGRSTAVTIRGDSFLVSSGTPPSLRIGTVELTATPGECTPLASLREQGAICKTLTATIAQGALPVGAQPIAITNPGPADCLSRAGPPLIVDGPPRITRIVDDLICPEQSMRSVRIIGTNFVELTDSGTPREPRVDFISSSSTIAIVNVSTATCTDVPGTVERRRVCSEVIAAVPPDVLQGGAYRVVVTNPPPLSCATREDERLAAVAPPQIDRLRQSAICRDAADRTVTIEGRGFLALGSPGAFSAVPRVTVSRGATVLTYDVPVETHPRSVRPSSCTSVAGAQEAAVECTTLAITLPPDLQLGDFTVSVMNPGGATACRSAMNPSVTVTGPPTIVPGGVSPQQICVQGGQLTITGGGFVVGAIANLGGIDAMSTSVANGGMVVSATWGSLAALTIDQMYPLTVRNPDNCLALADFTVRLTRGSVTDFVDPPLAYNGIDTRLVLFTSPIPARPIRVRIQRQGSGEEVRFNDAEVTFDPARPGRASVVLPRSSAAAPLPAGVYDVAITDPTGCENVALGALTLADRVELGLTSMAPSVGYFADDLEVSLSATAAPPRESFMPTPRAYLSPASGGAAIELRSLGFVDSTRLDAVIPNALAQLPIGAYDVVVVNPSGAVGVLRGGYRVSGAPSPGIDAIVPASIRASAAQGVEIQGTGFDLDPMCTSSGCVRLVCRSPGSPIPNVAAPAAVSSSQPTSIHVSIDGSALTVGSACLVRVTNQDGSFAESSALAISDPTSGAVPIVFSAARPLVTGRRSPAASGGIASARARFIYAIGGDRGSDANALASVEAAPVGPYGDLGAWFRVPIDLPEPRTRAGIGRIGRFLYLAGGAVPGTGPSNAVLRASILDPSGAPVIIDPDLIVTPGASGGLAAGMYSYRISAVRPANDRANPGGETLASAPLSIQVPSSSGNRVAVRVSWQAQSGAAGYRIYRTSADEPFGRESLVCAIGANLTTFLDDGDPTSHMPACAPDPNTAPLPLGSTGVWHTAFPDNMNVASPRPLMTARASAAMAVSTDRTSASFHHLFVIGGTDGASPLASYEHLTVQTGAPFSQTIGADWVTGAHDPLGRSELGALVADPVTAPSSAPGSCVFALGGRTGPAQTTGIVEAALTPMQGAELGVWVSTFAGPGASDVPSAPAGFASAIANDTLYLFGGARMGGTTPDATVAFRTLAASGGPCSTFAGSWSTASGANLRARYLTSSAEVGGFVYVVGGVAGASSGACGGGAIDVASSSCIVDGALLGVEP
jgi:large repetitive protein